MIDPDTIQYIESLSLTDFGHAGMSLLITSELCGEIWFVSGQEQRASAPANAVCYDAAELAIIYKLTSNPAFGDEQLLSLHRVKQQFGSRITGFEPCNNPNNKNR